MMFNGDKDWEKKFEALHRTKPGKFISASDDPKQFSTPPHPCSIYQIGKQSNMEMKNSKVDSFYTKVKLVHDPSARPCEFGNRFWDSNSPVFEFLQLACLEGCGNGGRSCWKKLRAAVERFNAGEEPLDDDENRLLQHLAVMKQCWDVEFIHAAAARIKLQDPSANTSATMDQVKAKYPNIGEGALAAAKHGLNVQTAHAAAERIKLQDPFANTSAIMDQVKASNPNIEEGAFTFFEGGEREKQRSDAKTISAEAARIKLQDPSADTKSIMDQVKARYPNIGKGAFNLVLPNIENKRKRCVNVGGNPLHTRRFRACCETNLLHIFLQ
jgi:hypothetical protein